MQAICAETGYGDRIVRDEAIIVIAYIVMFGTRLS